MGRRGARCLWRPPQSRMKTVTAKDGLVARDSGTWGLTKLSFLDHYCPAAIQATERKVQRYYVDLFAGPGINVVRGTPAGEYEGSPLRILRYTAQQREDLSFTDAVFINAMPRDHQALKTRVDRLVGLGQSRLVRESIELIRDDANRAISGILRRIPKRAYVLVFADMEAPKQWPWDSMKALKAQGHESVDLYTLFPLDMAIVRLRAYRKDHADRYAEALSRFFGTDAWRGLAGRRLTKSQAPQLRRDLVKLYLDQLHTLWKHAGEMVDVYLRGERRLYKMLFASDHPAGKAISDWIKAHSSAQTQGELFPEQP
jgi:three-Cys-motif partner protein